MSSRSRPFSAKQKKAQLQQKRAAKAGKNASGGDRARGSEDDDGNNGDHGYAADGARSRTASSHSEGSHDGAGDDAGGKAARPSKGPELRSVFATETREAADKKTEGARRPYQMMSVEEAFECDLEDYYGPDAVIALPNRPPWQYGMTKAVVEANEQRMFQRWRDDIFARYPAERLSYFEQNLEVWRQLWRVVEMSDIILLIVDVRHPLVHFPPALFRWVHDELKRPMVLVLNKIDLVEPDVVRAWLDYFHERFPDLHTATFSVYAYENFTFAAYEDGEGDAAAATVAKRTRARRRRYVRSVGVRDILNACRDVAVVKHGKEVEWQTLIERYSREDALDETNDGSDGDGEEDDDDGARDKPPPLPEPDAADDDVEPGQAASPNRDYVTIGLVGHPNVGKSSLINGILGKSVVSASRTPGHTKHFQTIHLTENVRLADCPGLVFPSLLAKPVQILSGMFNIAQVREPFTVVQYLAERVNLPELLDIVHPAVVENDGDGIKITAAMRSKPHPPWSAWTVCEGFALRKGFFTAKAGRPDAYRAANLILRLAFDGRLLLSMKPRGFYARRPSMPRAAPRRAVRSAAADDDADDDDDGDDADGVPESATRVFNPFALLGADSDDDES